MSFDAQTTNPERAENDHNQQPRKYDLVNVDSSLLIEHPELQYRQSLLPHTSPSLSLSKTEMLSPVPFHTNTAKKQTQQYSSMPSTITTLTFIQPKPQSLPLESSSTRVVSDVATFSAAENPTPLGQATLFERSTSIPRQVMLPSECSISAVTNSNANIIVGRNAMSEPPVPNPFIDRREGSSGSPKKRKSINISMKSPTDCSNCSTSNSPLRTLETTQQMQDKLRTSSNEGEGQQSTMPVLTEKKLRRLEKNRVSARECRRRKREAAESMVLDISALEAENVQLRLQLQIGQEAESSVIAEQQKLTSEIDTLLKSGEASEADIYCTLEEFKEKYADYGHSRRSSIEFHLRNIARLLMPTQTTSVVMHAFSSTPAGFPATTAHAATTISAEEVISNTKNSKTNASNATNATMPVGTSNEHPSPTSPTVTTETPQLTTTTKVVKSIHTSNFIIHPAGAKAEMDVPIKAEVATTPADALTSNAVASIPSARNEAFDLKGMFSFLVRYLEVTPEQAAALRDSRFVAQDMDACLEEALKVLTELRDRLAQTGDDLETEFSNVRAILTPTQAAKFLVWVANNAACMHMLNELWDRVYPCS